jgi:ATP-dependent RNA helicase DeaD
MTNLIFKELTLSEEVHKAIAEMGFEEATPIQSQSIPHILSGHDIIGQAQTGTGKTCAFGIPTIEMMDSEDETIQALVLCPTRELAIQTAEELKNVSKYKRGIRILPIYGGQPIDRQITALKQHPQIIIGTPGRIMDHMRRHTLKLENLKMLILDEADEMLNMGFREDIDVILKKVPEGKQTILFSATMPREILDLTTKYQKDPMFIKAVHKELTVPNTEQFYLEVSESSKPDVLSSLIDTYNLKLSLVFCNTKKRVDELASHLQSRGYMAEALHGDMVQAQRDKVMSKFRKGAIDVLIATDVAARGIDVDDIEAVFNYDIPSDEEYYVHRVGRTGRIGKAGKAFTLVSGRGLYKLKEIQRYTKSNIMPLKPPTLIDVEENKINKILDKLKTTIATGHLSKYVSTIEKLLEDTSLGDDSEKYITTLDIAAAFLKIAVEQKSNPERPNLNLDNYHDYDKSADLEKGKRAKFRPNSFQNDRGRNRRKYNETKVENPSSSWLT